MEEKKKRAQNGQQLKNKERGKAVERVQRKNPRLEWDFVSPQVTQTPRSLTDNEW